MSFMFNPYPYNDMTAVNHINPSEEIDLSVIKGIDKVNTAIKSIANKGVTALEGYIGINFESIVIDLQNAIPEATFINIDKYYKSSDILDRLLGESLPIDLEIDPISLFGRIFEGTTSDLLDHTALDELKKEVKSITGSVIIYGCGSACKELREIITNVIYYDLAPMNIVLRVREGKLKCIGDTAERTFRYNMRRLYYVDYEVCIRLRQELFENNLIDCYIDYNIPAEPKLITIAALEEIFQQIVEKPFRCKPCYCEGIWGGEYIKELRNLPKEMHNAAWVFDLIPNEVSLLAEVDGTLLEFPFIAFYRKMGIPLMGQKCVEKYLGVFPIRFNYDDNYHGGNMSIQVHPPKEYNNSNFGEPFQQDESYYVVFTAGSRTYAGFKDGANVDEFYAAIKKSEQDGSEVDYEKYVNSVVSRQGRQFMLPGGTIHSSGANQVVLEIGSWTVGSYTFKMYDYMRTDYDGKPRPIHSKHGINVMNTSCREEYVMEKLVPKRKLLREGDNWAEYIIGEHENIFFQLRTLEFYKSINDNTNNNFHVLNLVEGQKVRIESISNPEKSFVIEYLEMAVVPACLGKYRIINLGAGPVTVHKTLLK